MKCTLHLGFDKQISDVQREFGKAWPYLRLHFFRTDGAGDRKMLRRITKLKAAGLQLEGDMECTNETTVADLEKQILESFGLNVQVLRKSGNLWLQTTSTDSWTLGQQNQHGKEISQGEEKESSESGEDFDLERDNMD